MSALECAVAFTGPRPEKLPYAYGDLGALHRLGDLIEEHIYLLKDRGYTRFFSGMSRGVDLIAAERVLQVRLWDTTVKLSAAIPYAGQAAGWGQEDRALHTQIARSADDCITLSEVYTNQCFSRRNRFMVEAADLLLAVYDGKSGGGTAQTIDYATEKGIPIWLIDPVTLGVVKLYKD